MYDGYCGFIVSASWDGIRAFVSDVQVAGKETMVVKLVNWLESKFKICWSQGRFTPLFGEFLG
jgi:hypothetical protein